MLSNLATIYVLERAMKGTRRGFSDHGLFLEDVLSFDLEGITRGRSSSLTFEGSCLRISSMEGKPPTSIKGTSFEEGPLDRTTFETVAPPVEEEAVLELDLANWRCLAVRSASAVVKG